MNVCSSTLLGCNNVNFSKVLQFTLKLMRRRKTFFNYLDLGNYRWCFSSVRFCSLLGLSLHWFMRKWVICSFCLSSGSPVSDGGCRVGRGQAQCPWGAAAGERFLQKLQSLLCSFSLPPLSIALRVLFFFFSHVQPCENTAFTLGHWEEAVMSIWKNLHFGQLMLKAWPAELLVSH